MKKILLFLMIILATGVCNAGNDYDDAMYNLLESFQYKYIAANTKIVANPSSPCNQGEEPFMNFIKKFRNDKSFRNSRIKLIYNDQAELQILSQHSAAQWLNIKASRPVRRNGNINYGTWFNVKADEVCFASVESSPDNAAEGLAWFYQFRRINGKWFLVALTETAA